MVDVIPLLIESFIDFIFSVWGFQISFTLGQVIIFLVILAVFIRGALWFAKKVIVLTGTFVFTIVKNAVSAALQSWGERNADKRK